jgi:hypothetical protein
MVRSLLLLRGEAFAPLSRDVAVVGDRLERQLLR